MDSTQVILRLALLLDVEAMYQLDLLCFDERFRFDRRTIKQLLSAAGSIVLVAQHEDAPAPGELVGFIIAGTAGTGPKRRAYLSTLDVHPALRRNGIARKLLRAAEGAATKAGSAAMFLHVHTENVAAIQFYEAAGYIRQRLAPDYYGPGVNGWVYALALTMP